MGTNKEDLGEKHVDLNGNASGFEGNT